MVEISEKEVLIRDRGVMCYSNGKLGVICKGIRLVRLENVICSWRLDNDIGTRECHLMRRCHK